MVEVRRKEAIVAFMMKNLLAGFLSTIVFWQEGDVDKGMLSMYLESVF